MPPDMSSEGFAEQLTVATPDGARRKLVLSPIQQAYLAGKREPIMLRSQEVIIAQKMLDEKRRVP